MRILHFMNLPLSPKEIESEGLNITGSGGWLSALFSQMLNETNYKYACISFGKTKIVKSTHSDRITSFIVPGNFLYHMSSRSLEICRDITLDWKPDLIHIHGTESAFGLLTARNIIKTPCIISLQGLLGPCSQWYHFFGNKSFFDIIKMHRFLEIPLLRGLLFGYLKLKKLSIREYEIILGNHFFMGRTDWDKAYIRAINPTAQYFYGGELLRNAFWEKQWDINKSRRHRIICTNADHPRKGADLLIDAVKLLQYRYPDIQLAIAGNISKRSGYGKYIRRQINKYSFNIIELGPLNSKQMVKELIDSHVFVSPSYIDNSSNAVCEAQLLGMPVISTYTGGLPSLIIDGQTGIFFPTGDSSMLASKLVDIFDDDNLALRLGNQARKTAFIRHDPKTIINQILSSYDYILNNS